MSQFTLFKVHIERCKGFMSIIFFALKSQKKEFDIWEEEKWKGECQKDNYRITMLRLFSYFLSKWIDRKQRRRKLEENRQIDTVNRTQHGHNSAGCCTHIGLLGS